MQEAMMQLLEEYEDHDEFLHDLSKFLDRMASTLDVSGSKHDIRDAATALRTAAGIPSDDEEADDEGDLIELEDDL